MRKSILLCILAFHFGLVSAFDLQILSIDRRLEKNVLLAWSVQQIIWYAENDDLLCLFRNGDFFYKQEMKNWELVNNTVDFPSYGETTSLYQVKKTTLPNLFVCNARIIRPSGEKKFYITMENNMWQLSSVLDTNIHIDETIDVGKLGVEIPNTIRGYGRENDRIIPLDFGYSIHLATFGDEENDEASLLFLNSKKEVVIDYDSWREFHEETKTLDNNRHRYEAYTYKVNCVAVNSKKNRIAVTMNWYNGREASLLIFALIFNGVLNDSRVRLRTEPNLNSETLTYLTKGDTVKIIDRSTEMQKIGEDEAYWYKVEFEGYPDGWVYGKYVDVE